MPDQESKKNQHKKGKNDPKEQRKPRQQRNQGAGERKSEKKTEEPKVAASEKPAFEEPGPEFYKNLKRETDDIIKITEEANSKYKKKEIQSNWAKYEVPIESYEKVEEQENLGADYEKLIEAPLSLGGHFQFKHEKSWDVTTGPSPYDKYFDINMNDLATALCTIPFYERNGIDKTMFNETDIQTMDHRTSRYKHKYFKIATTESEIQDKLINSLKEDCIVKVDEAFQHERKSECEVDKSYENEISFDESNLDKIEASCKEPDRVEFVFKKPENEHDGKAQDKAEFVFKKPQGEHKSEPLGSDSSKDIDSEDIDDILISSIETNANAIKKPEVIKVNPVPEPKVVNKPVPAPTETKKAVIESPEDLEKWLDDFLEE